MFNVMSTGIVKFGNYKVLLPDPREGGIEIRKTVRKWRKFATIYFSNCKVFSWRNLTNSTALYIFIFWNNCFFCFLHHVICPHLDEQSFSEIFYIFTPPLSYPPRSGISFSHVGNYVWAFFREYHRWEHFAKKLPIFIVYLPPVPTMSTRLGIQWLVLNERTTIQKFHINEEYVLSGLF